MRFILNYINTKDNTHDIDREFKSLDALLTHVETISGLDWTSFQIVVVRDGENRK